MQHAQMPDLKLIKIFVTVVEHQGFTNAQQALNLSTSAISTYMSQLEMMLGMNLCQRGRSGFSLSIKGEMFYQEACRILQELEKFSQYTAQIQGDLHGTLSIGILDSIVTDTQIPMDRIIAQFSQQHPHTYLKLLVQTPYELQMGVLDNKIDLAIGSFFIKMQGIRYQALHKEQHWLFCSDRHALYTQNNLSPELIHCENMVKRGYWSQTELAKHGFTSAAATVESMEAQLILILSGQYLGYLPEHYAQYWMDQGRFKVLLPAVFGYQAPFSMIYRRGRAKEQLIQQFRETVVQHTLKKVPARSIAK